MTATSTASGLSSADSSSFAGSSADHGTNTSKIFSSAPTHQCLFCNRRFVVEGRCLRHMETVHAEELASHHAAETTSRASRRIFPAPEGRPTARSLKVARVDDYEGDDEEEEEEELCSRFQRVLHLLRPLTSLDTRIKTTLETQDADYDSDPLEEPADIITPVVEIPRRTHADEKEKEVEENGLRENYPDTPTIIGEGQTEDSMRGDSPWHPFRSGYEFKLAKWMMDSNLSKVQIDSFFNKGLARVPPANADGSAGSCFTSAYTLGQLLDKVDDGLGKDSWDGACVDHPGAGLIEFRYRSLEEMIRHIFKQASHADYMTYMPYKDYHRKTGYRIYSEMASAHWWWHMQVRYPLQRAGCLLIP